ncbi:SAM-dependent methyltransferase [Actinomadura kijaniata]|uniref:SAM-dependent methyltransferase n=1 Tax=Actinomadura kijaniata TaxID=46161 RepID=UPI000832F698|nr:SAM-dependent methyltransferase [Actinomadura kijaniata]
MIVLWEGFGVDTPSIVSIDTQRPHQARIWNHWLGGKENYPIDRSVGDKVMEVFPEIVDIARHTRAFLLRVTHFLVAEQGIRQILDIGTGLPTADNTHEVAQRIAPGTRVVYVDNDPLVLSHARALLTSTAEGATDYVDADVRDPATILEQAARTLDLDQPVALMLLGVMGNVPDADDPQGIVRTLMAELAPGSWLVVNDGTDVLERAQASPADETGRAEAIRLYVEAGALPYFARTPEFIAGYFEGLDLVEPGVVSTPLWRPDLPELDRPREVDAFCGVARKP